MKLILLLLYWCWALPAQAQLAKGLSKTFGGDFGVDAHPFEPSALSIFNYWTGNDSALWYENEPALGIFNQWIEHELSWAAGAPYELPSVLWGYYDVPEHNEPAWLVPLSSDAQIQAYIGWLKHLASVLPRGSRVDLIAEPLHTNMSTLERALGGTGQTGWDGFIQAIKLARQYLPGIQLGVLEYYIEFNDNPQDPTPNATSQYIAMVKSWAANGAPLDFVAAEGDFLENVPTSDLTAAMQRLSQGTGLPIVISQLAINTTDLANFQRIFVALWQSPYVVTVDYWADSHETGTSYCDTCNDVLWSGGVPTNKLLWLESYIPGSNPPNNFANPAPSPSPSPSPTPSPSPSPSPTPSPSPSPSPSAPPSPTPVSTPTPSPTATPLPSPTVSPTPTPVEVSPTPTQSSTPLSRRHRQDHDRDDRDLHSLWEQFIQWLESR
jgi:hypothetical protein